MKLAAALVLMLAASGCVLTAWEQPASGVYPTGPLNGAPVYFVGFKFKTDWSLK